MTRTRWIVAAAVFLLALRLVGAFYEFALIEIPEGYRGPVVIFYGHPNGITPDWRWGKRVYRVPGNGVLRIKSRMTSQPVYEEWVFVSPKGKRTPIPHLDDLGNVQDWSAITWPGLTQNVIANQGDQEWIQASIIVPSDRDTILENPHYVVDRVKDEISRLKESTR